MAGGNTVGGCSAAGGGCPVITLSPSTLPNGTIGAAYSQTIVASGGAPPYVFTVTSGTLPPGLTLTPTGLLAGTPTTAGTFTFTVRATDANGCFGSIAYTIVISAAPVPPPGCPVITLSPPILPPGTVGVAYTQTITGSGGTAPYTFGVTSGTLPAGLTLTAGGVLSGTPTTAGSSTVTIRGTDANGCFAEVVYTIVIAAAPVPPPGCPAITINPPTLPNGTVGVAYTPDDHGKRRDRAVHLRGHGRRRCRRVSSSRRLVCSRERQPRPAQPPSPYEGPMPSDVSRNVPTRWPSPPPSRPCLRSSC